MAETGDMIAVLLNGTGGPEVLQAGRKPRPRPGPGEILIAVHAAGINRPDVFQRMGLYPPPEGAPDWPGLEVAGEIVETGEGASRFAVGDRVMALVPGGGYAEYALAHEGSALLVPGKLSMVEAAAIPETYMTVWHNVFQRGALKPGESLLVHGGTSGIGTTAIQLAHALGSTVFATLGSADKAEAARRLGADHAINYREADFVEVVKQGTQGNGVDVILDMVGGDYVNRNIKAAAADGRIVQIATLHGTKAEIDAGALMRKRVTLTGSTLRPRSLEFKAALARELEERVWLLLADGTVAPLIDEVYPLEEAAAAHAHMDRDHIGKIVLLTERGRSER